MHTATSLLFLLATLFPLPSLSHPTSSSSYNPSIKCCTSPHYGGDCSHTSLSYFKTARHCSNNYFQGSIRSVVQPKGMVCTYYRDFDCQQGNHSPFKKVDSGHGEVTWGDMGDWDGAVLSFGCNEK